MGAQEHVTDADVTEALAALPDITAAEVAGALGIGRSTAAKRLARLEAAGVVRRTPGGRSGGAKVADRWSLAAPAPGPQLAKDHGPGGPAAPAAEPDPAPREEGPEEPDGSAGDGKAEPGGTSVRLAPGTLRTFVREYLAARPGQSFGPSGISKALGRSAGAVTNALSTMTADGEVELVAERPRRYRVAR